MENILDRARRLKIKLDPNIEKIAELQNEIYEVERERERELGECTHAHGYIRHARCRRERGCADTLRPKVGTAV
jgi:hypothetical protein